MSRGKVEAPGFYPTQGRSMQLVSDLLQRGSMRLESIMAWCYAGMIYKTTMELRVFSIRGSLNSVESWNDADACGSFTAVDRMA